MGAGQRGKRYTITQIIDTWQDWGFGKGSPSKKNWRLRHHRNYFIVRTDTEQLFKLYHDRGTKQHSPRVWILNEELDTLRHPETNRSSLKPNRHS